MKSEKNGFVSLELVIFGWFGIGWVLTYLITNNKIDVPTSYASAFSSFMGYDYSKYRFGREAADRIAFSIVSLLPFLLVSMFALPASFLINKDALKSTKARVRTLTIIPLLCLPTSFWLPKISGPLGLFSRNPYAFSSCIVLSLLVLVMCICMVFTVLPGITHSKK
ncbi:MAG: hypothetical protein JSR83_08710 [Proteobacteria bacterium]|nr:hypothetical protein [Pseudomonadota bacterium]